MQFQTVACAGAEMVRKNGEIVHNITRDSVVLPIDGLHSPDGGM
jgi:hypothetical protein